MAPKDPGVPHYDWGDTRTTSADTHAMIFFGGIILFGLIMLLIVVFT